MKNDSKLINTKLGLIKALETRTEQNGGSVITEDQLMALEKKKVKKEAIGEIETEYPGHLGAHLP